MIKITLKDGNFREVENGIKVIDFIKVLSNSLAKKALGAKVDGEVVELATELNDDCTLEVLTFDEQEGKDILRHTASHVLAQAVKRLYPEVKLAIGPSIENGFYYDFDVDFSFTPEILDKIEKEMNKIIKENHKLERKVVSREEALKLMQEAGEVYKAELINELSEDSEITFYTQGEFSDLCAGPHLLNTAMVKAVKLISSAGAYWRGSEKNKMLQRIYGTAFMKKQDLEDYLVQLEEAKKRDHNKLGRELKIFTTNESVGQGLPLIMPKGAKIIQTLQRFVEDEEERRGYVLTKTPIMAKNDLYKISGHWQHYKDGMFVIGDENPEEDILALRPMTCPFQYMIYNSEQHSYRELPVRYAETATLCRNESSGEMHGLIRVRQFTLSDGHIICTPEQLKEEFKNALDLVKYLMGVLGISEDISYRFSKWDPANTEKYINNPEAWNAIETEMRHILDELEVDYTEAIGEAAFYGPKLDIQFKNVHGKEDTIITIQIDFALAERFGMVYVDKDGVKKHPYIIHRSAIGCYERTLAMLIEKFAGAFPTWLAPTQVKVMNISENQTEYVKEVVNKLQREGIRAEADLRNEKIGYKIREAQLDKIPYMIILGEKEMENKEVAVRSRKEGDLGSISLEQFTSKIKDEIINKKINV